MPSIANNRKIRVDCASHLHNRARMDINFNFLRAFVKVAENANFRVASNQVHRSQSAISAQIRQLERDIGVPLFHRTTRRVQLTAAGELLLDAAQRGLHEVEHGLRQIQETVDLQCGNVALASSPIFAATHLPGILARFERDHPSVRITVHELTPAELYHRVAHFEVDFGIGPRHPTSDLHFVPVLDEAAAAIAPAKLWPHAGMAIDLAALGGLPLLMQSNATSMRRVLDDAAQKLGMVLRPKYECTQAQTLVAMARAGLGAAVLPASVMPKAPGRGMRVLPIVNPVVTRQMGLVSAPGRALAPAALRLTQLIQAQLARTVAQPKCSVGTATQQLRTR
jgi:DNA-binding transcriptional LysR family regulator